MWLLFVGLVLFIGLVVLHEWGHLLAARKSGVDVEEFGIGFPPALWKKRLKSGLLFTINVLPFGGFVRLKGEHDSATEPGSYGAARLSRKVFILLAGVGVNLFTAWVMLTALALIGMPRLPMLDGSQQFSIASDTNIISSRVVIGFVEPDSPAAKAGIKIQDELAVVDGVPVRTAADVAPLATSRAGQTVPVIVIRDGQEITYSVQLRSAKEVEAARSEGKRAGYFGVGPVDFSVVRSTWSAPIVAGGVIWQYTRLTFDVLGNAVTSLFRGNVSEATAGVGGPVAIVVGLREAAEIGWRFVLFLIALLSLSLAIMNTLPIPGLDGGRLAVTLISRKIFRRPLTPEAEERIHGMGFIGLLVLIGLLTVVDVRRFF